MEDYQIFADKMKELGDIKYALSVLNWDQEVNMPEKGAPFRAGQMATLTGIYHKTYTKEELGTLLSKLSQNKSLDFEQKRNVEAVKKDYDNYKKYSLEFVTEMSHSVSEAFQAWHKAKNEDDFSIYAPKLEKIVQLKREECELLGYEGHPYNALLDQFEEGARVKDIDPLFSDVKKQLVDFVKDLSEAPQVEDDFMYKKYDKDKQWQVTIELLKQMGYDFNAGRQDISTHPFTTSFNPRDVRITTRINEHNLSEVLWSSIHEGGHALYEQGLKSKYYGLPQSEAVSLGIHESQSRLWENNVGRSSAYWQHNFKKLSTAFPENLKNVNASDFYKAMNKVQSSLIRTNSDEITYHFHILIRYEIEKALINKEIEVNDLPQIWNEKYKQYLNIDVPSDAKGVLQDIHWSHGSIGYFPTYSLGSFYAAQFFAQAQKDIPQLEEKISTGQLKPLLDWLRENIHQYGRTYKAHELCKRITGEELDFKYFMDYADRKYKSIYFPND